MHRIVVGELPTICYLIGDSHKEGLIVDPGAEAEKIIERIKKKHFNTAMVVLTHSHYDHIGAAKEISEHFDIPIYAYFTAKEALADPELNFSAMTGHPVSVEMDEHLEDGDILRFGERFALRVMHTPGHSEDSICLIGEGFILTGDTLFADSIGRTDLPGGDRDKLVLSLRQLLIHPDDTVIYPGHGEASTIGAAKKSVMELLG